MNPSDVQAFVHRDWEVVQASKTAYWAHLFEHRGWGPAWAASDALWIDVRRAQPDYPSAGAREGERAHHLRLCDLLDRAASAFTSR